MERVGDCAHIADAAQQPVQKDRTVRIGSRRRGRYLVAKEKERDWDKEMRQVDKLLAKLPDAEPTLGRGVPTVPVSPRPAVGGAPGTLQPGPARGRAWI